MEHYVGIDASLETVNVCVVDDEGAVCLERKIEAEPEAIITLLKGFGHPIVRLGLEAGPTASWLFSELRTAGLPAICMECRHVKAGLGAMRNKTDRNDARGIAQLVRLGWFRRVFVKSEEAQRTRMLLVSRSHVLGKSQDIENCIRGSLKVFGLRIGAITKSGFEDRVLELFTGDQSLIAIVKPLLRARRAIIEAFERLDRLCIQLARRDPTCRRLMTIPGVGVIVALTYVTGVDAWDRLVACQRRGVS